METKASKEESVARSLEKSSAPVEQRRSSRQIQAGMKKAPQSDEPCQPSSECEQKTDASPIGKSSFLEIEQASVQTFDSDALKPQPSENEGDHKLTATYPGTEQENAICIKPPAEAVSIHEKSLVVDSKVTEIGRRGRGRPPLFSTEEDERETMDRIFSALESGAMMTDICKDLGFDRSTIWRHIRANLEFCNAHARAREAQADALADKATQIADDGRNDTYVDSDGRQRVDYDNIRRSELRVRHYQWLCARLAPHIYGDCAATVNVQQNNLHLADAHQDGRTGNAHVVTEEAMERARASRRAARKRVLEMRERCGLLSNSAASGS